MEKLGVIAKVDQPTDWCTGIVTAPKPNGKIRRSTYPFPKIYALFGEIEESTVFTKIDANYCFGRRN